MNYFKKINVFRKSNSKNFYSQLIIISFMILILFKQMNFFKNFYFTITRDYKTRLINNYEYCGQESIGFLFYIKNRFNITYKIPIINYGNSPNSSWYYNNLETTQTNKVIFLNYTKSDKNITYNNNSKFSHDLDSYKILYKDNNCYLLEKNG